MQIDKLQDSTDARTLVNNNYERTGEVCSEPMLII